MRSVTTTEPEWDSEQVAYLLASRKWEEDTGPEGFSMEIATNPDNKFRFKVPTAPRKNYAAAAISKGAKAYYAKYDTDPKKPIDRAGDMWTTELLD